MTLLHDTAAVGTRAPHLIIMLPAAFSAPADFASHGFVAAVRARQLPLDLAFTQLELESVTDRSMLERLREELILPARARDTRVWLGGISLGGFLALSFAARHAAELAGLVLFAPYLGSHIITGEIERAGGAPAWVSGDCAPDDEERQVWHFIGTLAQRALPVHLGLGREDRFAARHRLLAGALPAGDVDTVPGGHDWATWRTLWERFLDRRFAAPHLSA
jgi:pimeloyl-ACP methyl ester carboxylesterase